MNIKIIESLRIAVAVTFLFVFMSLSSCKTITPVTKWRHSEKFTLSTLIYEYPFSVLIGNNRYGVIVNGNNVKFIYPYDAVKDPKKSHLFCFLENPADLKQIQLDSIPSEQDLDNWFIFELKDDGEKYMKDLYLPNGIYGYFVFDMEYNPAVWDDGFARQNFFFVGNNEKLLNSYGDLWWLLTKRDKTKRQLE